jgi:hypothetical protein
MAGSRQSLALVALGAVLAFGVALLAFVLGGAGGGGGVDGGGGGGGGAGGVSGGSVSGGSGSSKSAVNLGVATAPVLRVDELLASERLAIQRERASLQREIDLLQLDRESLQRERAQLQATQSPCPSPAMAPLATPPPAPSSGPPPAPPSEPATYISLSVQCRLYGGRVFEAWTGLLPSMMLFLPWQGGYAAWPGLEVALIWDGEQQLDQHSAMLLASLPPYPSVFLEAPCPPGVCPARYGYRDGYIRQQYSNFYGDAYTNATLIGFVDSDNVFVSPMTPHDVVGASGKPIVLAFQSSDNVCKDESGRNLIFLAMGRQVVLLRMVASTFPVIIRREDLPAMRASIAKHMGVQSFEEAYKILGFCQFDIMVNWLWYFRRDAYEWHIKDVFLNPSYTFGAVPIEDPETRAAIAALNTPLTYLVKNNGHHNGLFMFQVLTEYMCLALRSSPAPTGGCDFSASERAGLSRSVWEDSWLRSLRNDNSRRFQQVLPPRGYPQSISENNYGNFGAGGDGDWDIFTGMGPNETWLSMYARHERDFLAFRRSFSGVGGVGAFPFVPVRAEGALICQPHETVARSATCAPQGALLV